MIASYSKKERKKERKKPQKAGERPCRKGRRERRNLLPNVPSSVVDDHADSSAVRVLLRSAISRIIDVVDVVASARGGKNIVTAVLNVEDDTVTSVDAVASLLISGVLGRLELEAADAVHGTPVDKAAAGIAAVVAEPGVHDAGIATPAAIGTVHGDGGDGTASTADGVAASAELVAAPLGVALAPERSIDAADGRVGS